MTGIMQKSWILHQDNAPAHNALSVKQILANHITVLEHPPCSPDLAPCDFYLFQKIKSVLKGTRFFFSSVEDVKAKTTEILVDFLNLINKKRYRQSLLLSVSDHVYALI
jgi:histone-lysine N-methyltransferase SETMAR